MCDTKNLAYVITYFSIHTKTQLDWSAQWSYKFVKHAFKVEKLLFIQAFSTITTYKALFGEYGTSVQT